MDNEFPELDGIFAVENFYGQVDCEHAIAESATPKGRTSCIQARGDRRIAGQGTPQRGGGRPSGVTTIIAPVRIVLLCLVLLRQLDPMCHYDDEVRIRHTLLSGPTRRCGLCNQSRLQSLRFGPIAASVNPIHPTLSEIYDPIRSRESDAPTDMVDRMDPIGL